MRDKKQILIVDDQKVNIDILVNILEDEYELLIANSGEVALGILTKECVDLILLDIVMAQMSGYDVCEAIKHDPELKDIPIIFLTSQQGMTEKKKGFDLGAVDYITKPFNVEELKVRISAHLTQYLIQKKVLVENEQLAQEVDLREIMLEDANAELRAAYLETIERLSRAAEYKDDRTGFHVKRVGEISAIIAGKMGLDNKMVHAIRHAAPLHDIGKIGIPEGILLKPGRLTVEEYELMKKHTSIGKDILKDSSSYIINLAEIIAYTHHERWDGKGYPLGLVGEQIPVVSRVVAIADVFDALISERPYKRAFTFNEALAIIMEEEHGHFSEDVLSAFLSSLDDIEETVTRFQ